MDEIYSETRQERRENVLLEAFGLKKVINLRHRVDRRDEFINQLKNIGIEYHHQDDYFFDAIMPDDLGSFPSVGAYGCFLSHLEILKDARDRGLEAILICEDDLNFSRDFNERAEQTLSLLTTEDWALFYGFQPDGLPTAPNGLAEIPPSLSFQCAHFVAFRRPAIEALVPYLEAMLERPAGHADGGPMHVDGAYYWFRQAHPHLRAFAATPSLGYQRSSVTDIAALNFVDRSIFLKPLMRFARKLKNQLRG